MYTWEVYVFNTQTVTLLYEVSLVLVGHVKEYFLNDEYVLKIDRPRNFDETVFYIAIIIIPTDGLVLF